MTSVKFRVPGTLAQALEERGISVARVLAEAGLPPKLLQQDKIMVTTAEFFALYRSIANVTPNQAIGLQMGAELSVGAYDPASIAALCSRSFGDAIERLGRYKMLSCPEEIHILPMSAEVGVEFRFLLGNDDEPPLLIDVCLAWIVAIGIRGTGHPIVPLRLETTRTADPTEMLEKHFGCPVHYGSARNILVFSARDLQRPFLTHNQHLLEMLGPQLEAELNDRNCADCIGKQAKQAIKSLLAGRRPRVEEVASRLGLTSRTLQRKLTQDGLSFQQLLESARRELAHHYLSRSAVELNEAAYLLGYDDANSFFRAFHRWEGTSPGQWRSQHRRQLAMAAPG